MDENSKSVISSKITIGSILLWLAFAWAVLPCFNVFHYRGHYRAFYNGLAALLFLGFVISCWQDARTKTPFSFPRLVAVLALAFVHFVIMRPLVFGAAE